MMAMVMVTMAVMRVVPVTGRRFRAGGGERIGHALAALSADRGKALIIGIVHAVAIEIVAGRARAPGDLPCLRG
jgi:hypothetical protein